MTAYHNLKQQAAFDLRSGRKADWVAPQFTIASLLLHASGSLVRKRYSGL